MGLRLCLDAAASLARTMAPAPSEIPDALPAQVKMRRRARGGNANGDRPAVTQPSFWNKAGSFATPGQDALKRNVRFKTLKITLLLHSRIRCRIDAS